jgi:LAS superfamily LD-carboxypeptidase LdcB
VNPHELTGQSRTHVVAVTDPSCTLHAHVVVPFMNLHRAARADGFDLRPVSAFRDFDRQLAIWNGKFSGERPLYDAAGCAIDASQLSPPERIAAILRWSALPGASRHHWGTDVDLIDANALAPGSRVQLSAEEYADSGPFGPLAAWLGAHAARFGFFRPYRGVLSGVQAEPWHFSFAPVAETARRALGPAVLGAALASVSLMGKEHVLARLDELHARYVAAIDWP